jgi:hypothetical protein
VQGVPGTGKDLRAMTEGHRMPELVISPREVTRSRANLAVGQLSGGQPVSHFDWERGQAHRKIMPHPVLRAIYCVGGHFSGCCNLRMPRSRVGSMPRDGPWLSTSGAVTWHACGTPRGAWSIRPDSRRVGL